MASRRKLLGKAKLYLILDRQVNTYDELFEIAKKSISAGADMIQLRDKLGSAKDILEFSRRISKLTKGRILFIVNDRVELALLSGASGVHVGQEDIPLKWARQILGPKAIIGVSCQTLAHAQRAAREGADYIGFGSVFKTLTKPQRSPMDLDSLKKIYNTIKIPVFAIGGINLKNISQIKAMGVNRAAVCRSVCLAKDIKQATKSFKKILS